MRGHLKPCPFCGAEARLVRGKSNLYLLQVRHTDRCFLLNMSDPISFDKTALIDRWNRRYEEKAQEKIHEH